MKLSNTKLVLLAPITSLIIVFVFISYWQTSNITPLQPYSSKNNFQNKLNYALNLSRLQPLKIKYQDFHDKVEFTLNHDSNSFIVIFSSQKDPVWQVASLQNLLKAAKMKQRNIAIVDLSVDHPYVTFKNN